MAQQTSASLARFAVERGHLTPSGRRRLLRPNSSFELSVFYIDSLTFDEVCSLGIEVVKRRPEASQLYGLAVLDESAIYEVGLQLHRDDSPPRHANVIGWPQDRQQLRFIAQQLASRAVMVPLNPPVTADQA